MAVPENLLYSKEHEWVKIDGDTATIGITDYAQNSLGDIVYVELPKVGDQFEAVRHSASSNPSKRRPTCMRRSRVKWSRSTATWSTSRRASTTIPTSAAGWSKSALPTRRRSISC